MRSPQRRSWGSPHAEYGASDERSTPGAFREAFTAEFEPYDRRAREPTGLEG